MAKLTPCTECGGSGLSGYGSGYDAVCGHCGGQRVMPAERSAKWPWRDFLTCEERETLSKADQAKKAWLADSDSSLRGYPGCWAGGHEVAAVNSATEINHRNSWKTATIVLATFLVTLFAFASVAVELDRRDASAGFKCVDGVAYRLTAVSP